MSWVFCAIVAGEAAAIPIYEDDNYLAILDIRPVTRGHTLGRRLVKGWGSAQRCPSPKYVGEVSDYRLVLRDSDHIVQQGRLKAFVPV